MKIGIFGDSFVDKNFTKPDSPAWWELLEKKYGHDIECFGESGSSIVYSAQLILEKYQNYDFIIWAVSNPPRITVRHRKNVKDIPVSVHITGRHAISYSDPDIQEKIKVAEDYLLKVYDWDDGNFISNCVIKYVEKTVPHLLMIPCFIDPWLGTIDFNLFDLCQKETDFYFPNVGLADIYDKYTDNRVGHLSNSTHVILSALIANNLKPGTFRANYSDFKKPLEPFLEIFSKK